MRLMDSGVKGTTPGSAPMQSPQIAMSENSIKTLRDTNALLVAQRKVDPDKTLKILSGWFINMEGIINLSRQFARTLNF